MSSYLFIFVLSKEMALEVLGRISFALLSQSKKDRLQTLLTRISPMLKIQLNNKKSIQSLLKDMRPILNKVNESNRNIVTFAISTVLIDSEAIADSSWLDLSRSEMFCFYSEKFDVYLKFSFAHVAEATHKLPLVLEVRPLLFDRCESALFNVDSVDHDHCFAGCI